MKKTIIIFLIIFAGALLFSEESNLKKSENADNGIEIFLTKNIGKDVSVAINNSDVVILGVLRSIYKDAIVVATVFKQEILIPKSSIAYLKVNTPKKDG
jgi:hypothetical protein